MTLLSFSVEAVNELLWLYVVSVASGETITGQPVRSSTIQEYLQSADIYLREVGNRPRQPMRDPATGKLYKPIASVLTEIARWEALPNKVSPVTQRMIRCLYKCMQVTHADSKQRAFFDWSVVAISIGYRKCEWAVDNPPKNMASYPRHQADVSGDKGYYTCVANNWRLLKGNGIYVPYEEEDAIPKNEIMGAEITIPFQKNGNNGEKQSFVRNHNNPMFDVPLAIQRIKIRARKMGLVGTQPISVYQAQPGSREPSFFFNHTIIPLLQWMACNAYDIKDLKTAGLRYTEHSFQVGAAVLMYCNGASETEIQKRLRWTSSCYQLYLRNMPQTAVQHMRMFNHGDVESWDTNELTFSNTAGSPLTT